MRPISRADGMYSSRRNVSVPNDDFSRHRNGSFGPDRTSTCSRPVRHATPPFTSAIVANTRSAGAPYSASTVATCALGSNAPITNTSTPRPTTTPTAISTHFIAPSSPARVRDVSRRCLHACPRTHLFARRACQQTQTRDRPRPFVAAQPTQHCVHPRRVQHRLRLLHPHSRRGQPQLHHPTIRIAPLRFHVPARQQPLDAQRHRR